MNEDYAPRPNSADARLAVLEEQARALSTRLNFVSDRAYSLTGSMEEVLAKLEAAREQRTELVERVDQVNDKLNNITTLNATAAIDMAHHVRMCDRRSARIEKLGWTMVSAILGIAGFLAAQFFVRVFHP